ncbi:MAG: nicotinate-nucleotide adenylyltransferase [Coriobacteriales bacterium]|jgi:nicotinate-nucleotide adenylyltransferase|nr:nicotinate-nucleotide adenylyltransferase [Coriobacteriales bacterium]
MSVTQLGILGGAFDPVHVGHLELAEQAVRQFDLDRLLFVPSGHSVRKDNSMMTPPFHRMEMLHLATTGVGKYLVSPLEIDRTGPSYTIDTLEEIRRIVGPTVTLFLVCGSDAALDLPTWKEADRIAALVKVLSAPRTTDNADNSSVATHRTADDLEKEPGESSDSNGKQDSGEDTKTPVTQVPKDYPTIVRYEDFDVTEVDMPENPVSSSDIRRRLRNSLSVDGLMPADVLSYIEQHGLYV